MRIFLVIVIIIVNYPTLLSTRYKTHTSVTSGGFFVCLSAYEASPTL